MLNGEPALVLAGEIHSFGLRRNDWQQRLDRVREAGLHAIATYVPWLWLARAGQAPHRTRRGRRPPTCCPPTPRP
ncbi:hypothetical protein DEH69_07570 [Streptomyces sp. PT12]|nr:hypothetical protein DEH69_07570 [Streptomyces sp. PT12]